ncbi:MAG: DUF58 domain-containing protein [Blastopirellula sp. JB062]
MISFSSGADSPHPLLSHRMGWVLGCVLATALLNGTLWHGRALIVAGMLLLIVLVGLLFPYLSIRNLQAKAFPLSARGEVGRALPLRLQIRNLNLWAWGTVIIQVFDAANASERSYERMIPRIDRRGVVRETWETIPQVRGYFPNKTGEFRTRFPFGLKTARKNFVVESQAVIWPEIIPIRGRLSASRHAGRHHADSSSGRWGEEGDISGPRPHQPGESLRRVHWRHTARYGSLIVCERESASSHRLRIRLDLLRRTETDLSYEIAISAAASLMRQAVDSDWQVDLDLAGVRNWEGIDRTTLFASLDFLATFDAQTSKTVDPQPPTARAELGRCLLVTHRPPTDEHEFARYDAVVYVAADRLDERHIGNVIWLKTEESWRDALREVGDQLDV